MGGTANSGGGYQGGYWGAPQWGMGMGKSGDGPQWGNQGLGSGGPSPMGNAYGYYGTNPNQNGGLEPGKVPGGSLGAMGGQGTATPWNGPVDVPNKHGWGQPGMNMAPGGLGTGMAMPQNSKFMGVPAGMGMGESQNAGPGFAGFGPGASAFAGGGDGSAGEIGANGNRRHWKYDNAGYLARNPGAGGDRPERPNNNPNAVFNRPTVGNMPFMQNEQFQNFLQKIMARQGR